MHPAQKIKRIKGNFLENKKIVLGITGSISAEETVKLSRELIRYGAEVIPVMTEHALEMITPEALEFATGNKAITKITGKVEHVTFLDDADLLLIAPCSANTIGKIVNGIGDTTVSLFALSFLGQKPVLIAPAMNLSMLNNPVVKENIVKLERIGVEIIRPKIEESKAKLADIDTILAHVIRILNNRMKNKKVLVIGGATEEPIDDFRVITNRSSGKTSVEIARACFFFGADVDLYLARSEISPLGYINVVKYRKVEDIIEKIDEFLKYDLIIVPAALSDFHVNKFQGKLESGKSYELKLEPLPKFIEKLREKFKNDLVVFKAESGKEKLIEKAREYLEKYNTIMVIANDVNDVKFEETEIFIVDKNGYGKIKGNKENVAVKIIEHYLKIKGEA